MSLPSEKVVPASESPSRHETSSQEPYTVFSSQERRLIVALLGATTLVSPLTATIYLPLLPLLAAHFRTTSQAINLTITVYIIFQALAPLFLASISDHFGRRPIYLATFALFSVASLGLALNRSSYAVLIVLRAIQSLGASAVLSVNYGTVADICVPANRGKMLGPVLAAGNLGTCIGPIVGGWIALKSGDFRWAFWTLVIFGALMLTALVMFLPETARKVVGNGSIRDRPWNQPLLRIFPKRCPKCSTFKDHRTNYDSEVGTSIADCEATTTSPNNPERTFANTNLKRSFKIQSPLDSIRLIFYLDTSLTIWLSSSYYALWYCIQASIPSTYKATPYAFNELEIGLAYFPGAIGVIFSMYVAGKAMDRNYKHTAAKIGFKVDKVSGDDLANFPIEQARSYGCEYLLFVSIAVMVGYGWSIAYHVHVAVPLILQVFQGFLSTWFIQSFSALLVDAFPEMPSTAATAGNIMRCALSAVAVAVLQPLVDILGKGWFFTMLGLISGVGGLAAQTALRRWGLKWRKARREKKRHQRDGVHAEKAVEESKKNRGEVARASQQK